MRLNKKQHKLFKKYGFKVLEEECHGKVTPLNMIDNLTELTGRNQQLLTGGNIKRACSRAYSSAKDLVVIEDSVTIIWVIFGKKYKLQQFHAVLVDGNSTPVNIGHIQRIAPHNLRAFKVHDDLNALFTTKVDSKTADRIHSCFLLWDGSRVLAQRIQYSMLRLFGRKARCKEPHKHWNFGRVHLKVEDYNE
jgi:hypothetical protein